MICECCGRDATRLEYDHDHLTGLFRGRICRSCNFALGNLGDNAAGVERALAYLRRPVSGLTYREARRIGRLRPGTAIAGISAASVARWRDADTRAKMQRNGDQARAYWDRLRANPDLYKAHCDKLRSAVRKTYEHTPEYLARRAKAA